ncbi:GNAT family N-acetyltransferase [Rhodanobacter glycinis]|uniref:Acetyltransferase (GNAT) family protein n=1 Tax=Rhodanobacter glycinis TaxID=582702 RepID=A0A1I4D679_9GAMM|nr:GNAT family N-acetyltransferase [Rhodanobacter glycinis]SFK88320.1 Acetyltransferase (GNAT) family protein [Rhodanobacter glycinis]
MSTRVLELSEVDTARFGFRMARGRLELDDDVSDRLISEIHEHRYDIEILRVPAGALQTLRGARQRGMMPIHADTLVYYEASLPGSISPSHVNAGIRYELATAKDIQDVARVATEGFAQYRNHYHANTLLEPSAILEGYVQWATSSLVRQCEGQVTYIAKSGEQTLGFIACRLNRETNVCEVILNAVAPDCQGRGIYTQGLVHVMSTVSAVGYRRLVISTQVWNYRVQQVWARLGMSLYQAYDTYHFNNVGGLSAPASNGVIHRAEWGQ